MDPPPLLAASLLGRVRSSFRMRICIDGVSSGRFDDLLDAMASARIAKHERPLAKAAVMVTATGKIAIEVEA